MSFYCVDVLAHDSERPDIVLSVADLPLPVLDSRCVYRWCYILSPTDRRGCFGWSGSAVCCHPSSNDRELLPNLP